MPTAPKIAIVGAGPAGLTLARILQVHKIPCTVFEKDPTSTPRITNGGCLDLHPGSGQGKKPILNAENTKRANMCRTSL